MRIGMKQAALAAMLGLAASPVLAQETSGEEGWDWVVAPYLWASTIGVDLRRDLPPVENETRFNDIVSKIDMAFLMHVEGQGDRFGVFGDITYLSLSDDKTHPRYRAEADVDATIFELAGVWNVAPERFHGFDLYGGLRYYSVDLGVALDPTNPALAGVGIGLDKSYSDFLFGGRYNARLAERWGLTLRADGSWGDTDGSYSASAMFSYHMKRGSWLFGYRHMEVELPTVGQSVDLSLSGPVFAYAFRF